MGLLGFNPDLSDPKTQGLIALGLSLMSPTPVKMGTMGQIGRAGMEGLQTYGQARQYQMQQDAMERANRASDLQQLGTLYGVLRQQEPMRALLAKQQGVPFTPNPMLDTLSQRMSGLMDLGNMSGKVAGMAPPPSAAPPLVAPVPQGPSSASVGPPAPIPGATPGPAPSSAAPPSPPSSPTASFGDPALGIDPLQFYASDPSGKSYIDALIAQNKPLSTRYGIFQYNKNTNRADPIGGALPANALPYGPTVNGQPTVGPLPGQLKTQAQQTAATTLGTQLAKFPFETRNVTLGTGATVPTFTQKALGQPNLGPLSQLFGNSGPLPQGAPQVPPSAPPSQPAIPPAVAAAAAQGQPFEATQTPDGKVTVNKNPQGNSDPWSTMPTIQESQGIGQTSYQKQLSDKRAEVAGKLADQFSNEADAANQRIATNNQALDLVSNADTGWLATHIGQFRNILASVGVKSAADSAATDQVLAKDLANTALQRGRQLFGARFTQSEVGIMLTRANPGPEMQQAAIKFLLNTDNAMQGYNIQRASDYGRYLNSNGDPLQFGGWYTKTFPMTNVVKGVPGAPIPQAAPQSAPNIDALVQKYRTR